VAGYGLVRPSVRGPFCGGVILAALLAILTELAFEGIEKLVIPRHLLQKPAE
jgi:hypothetical protein